MDHLLSEGSNLPMAMKRCIRRTRSNPSANQWLCVTPCAITNTALNATQYRDGINIRYGWDPKGLPATCVCGKNKRNALGHALICMSGGGVVGRHNIIKNELAFLAGEELSHSPFHVVKEVSLLNARCQQPVLNNSRRREISAPDRYRER